MKKVKKTTNLTSIFTLMKVKMLQRVWAVCTPDFFGYNHHENLIIGKNY